MSTLIIGGAFVVALLALIGLVFLVRSESSANVAGAKVPPQARPESVPVVAASIATPQESVSQRPVTGQRMAPVTQKLPLHLEEQLSALQEEEAFPVSNEQLHELLAQLSILHEQAQEFEHRLSILTEIILRIEHAQDDHVSFEEDEEAYAASR